MITVCFLKTKFETLDMKSQLLKINSETNAVSETNFSRGGWIIG